MPTDRLTVENGVVRTKDSAVLTNIYSKSHALCILAVNISAHWGGGAATRRTFRQERVRDDWRKTKLEVKFVLHCRLKLETDWTCFDFWLIYQTHNFETYGTGMRINTVQKQV